jgi:hypothetical protein
MTTKQVSGHWTVWIPHRERLGSVLPSLKIPMHAGSGRTRGTIAPHSAPSGSGRDLLGLLLEKSEEAGRGVDRQLVGEGEQVIIARDQHRGLGRGEGKQVVVSWGRRQSCQSRA